MATNICKNCGKQIMVAIFQNEDWCCENCRKALHGETAVPT